MKNKYFIKLVSLMLSVVLMLGSLTACQENKPNAVDLSPYLTQLDNVTESDETLYSNYIKQFKDDKNTENVVVEVINE